MEKQALADVEKWSNLEERIWQQKFRVDWIMFGDRNTKFFHAFTKARLSGKAIKLLIKSDGTRCITQNQIKEEVRNFYANLMGSAVEELPMVDKHIIERGNMLTQNQQMRLCAAITNQEVMDALFSMNPHKAPGIDGFNVFFFKNTWNIIGDEVTNPVKDLFVIGFLPKTVNTTLVTLLPKSDQASSIKDYRPIACCCILYKIISKILTNRMQGVLDWLISENQLAFVKGRVIFDNILLSLELIKGYNRKNVSPRCMVKIDIKKAYDSVEWPFIKHLLLELGFPYRFVTWIMACLTSVSDGDEAAAV